MIDPYLKLAKDTITQYVNTGKTIAPPDDLPAEMIENRAGVFVSLHQKDGSLRGCIGTFLPTQFNLAREIIANAIAAATTDPRFPPVIPAELPDLVYSVDILSTPKPISNPAYLNPKKYGLIVSCDDGRGGLLLPDIPGVETAEQQIEICRQKGGIGQFETYKMEIFTVERHEEKG